MNISGKSLLVYICAVLLAIFAVIMKKKQEATQVIEPFWSLSGASFGWKTQNVLQTPASGACPGSISAQKGFGANGSFGASITSMPDDMFVKTVNMQTIPSPRMMPSGTTPFLRYSPPDVGNQALDQSETRLSSSCGSKENYAPSCGVGGSAPPINQSPFAVVPSSYMAGATNYQQNLQEAISQGSMPGGMDLLPVSTMSQVGADGAQSNPVVFKQFMFANARSKLRGRADMIRGDLAIAPCSAGWFSVSVSPNIDLNPGALNVMAGASNETATNTAKLVAASAGTSNIPFGGVANPFVGNNNTPQYASASQSLGTDIQVVGMGF